MLKLVKDFEDFKIVYYWVDTNKASVSPHFPTLAHAKEWFIRHQFAQHEGAERRKRQVDRRSLRKTSPERGYSKRSPTQYGRRATDQPIHVDIDLASKKLDKLMSSTAEGEVKQA